MVLVMMAAAILDFLLRARLRACLKKNDLPVHFAVVAYDRKADILTAKNALDSGRIEDGTDLSEIVSNIERLPYGAVALIILSSVVILATN